MINDMDLPDQFPNPRDTLPAYAQQWWDRFANGAQPDITALQQIPAYRTTWELFCEATGRNASGTAAAFSELKKAERKYYAAVRAMYPNQYRVPQTDYNGMVRDALDFYQDGEKRSASGIVGGYVPKEHARAVANRKGQRKRMRRAIEANKPHPAYAAITSRIGKQGVNSMAQDTVSMTLVRLMMEAGTQRTLDTMSYEVAELKAQVAALEAFQSATEKRHTIEDAGQDPKELARSMRASGKSLGEIAKATGRSRSTVQRWVK
ncbi:helix-turn-helix domain-containing protein [Serratia rhizosphaerae]|uniref:Helix-turn-helix domain-containing protein n=1 Tax=Serratia rhizosphaerae TaxID=2597702 RepID=A0ABX6GPK7_9GAMM|nr:helix-turn-helix domain-containing protein [Serratia rhizosphaerae]MBU3894477.1 helix-turn-helix domain-containing protein [Serratia rubidaea]QHA88195.1 helix-turn-helix domain-containing protein [Serratia rhizosphaerae]